MQPSDKSAGIGIKFQCILEWDGRGGVVVDIWGGGYRVMCGH